MSTPTELSANYSCTNQPYDPTQIISSPTIYDNCGSLADLFSPTNNLTPPPLEFEASISTAINDLAVINHHNITIENSNIEQHIQNIIV
jgi:hypothetical protein